MRYAFPKIVLLFTCALVVSAGASAQRGGEPGRASGPERGGAMAGPMTSGPGRSGDFGHMGGRADRSAASPGVNATPVRGPQLGPPGRWWDDHKLARNLNLRTDQQRRMDDIFNANKGQLLGLYSNLQREEQRLATMPSADLQDETKVFAGIDRVAQARADLEKENAHILLQIRHELDAGQLEKLDKAIASR